MNAAIPSALRFHSRKGALVRRLLARRGAMLANLPAKARDDLALVHETRTRTALLMTDAAALHLVACARAASGLEGAMAEAGVLMGGSARLIATVKGAAPLHLFDVFETLQADDAPRSAVGAHFGEVYGTLAAVEALLTPFAGISLHPGLFPHSAAGLEGLRFSFAHLDLDLPEGTRAALEFFYPRLVPGGILLGDDYADPGVRGTFEDFFAERAETLIALPWSQGMIVKR
jgi:O-methyltransferase